MPITRPIPGNMNSNLSETNALLANMAEHLKYLADNTKQLEDGTKKVTKETKSLVRQFANLSRTDKENPLGKIGGRGWLAIRQISARLLPGFWRFQSAVTGVMNTIQTIYLIGDKISEGERLGIIEHMRRFETKQKEKALLLEELEISKEIFMTNKDTVEKYSEQQEKIKAIKEELDQLEGTPLSHRGEDHDEQVKKLTYQMRGHQGAAGKIKKKLGAAEESFQNLGPLQKKMYVVNDKLSKAYQKYHPTKIMKDVKMVGRFAKVGLAFMAKALAGILVLYILAKRFNLVDLLKGFISGLKIWWSEIKEPLFKIFGGIWVMITSLFDIWNEAIKFLSGEQGLIDTISKIGEHFAKYLNDGVIPVLTGLAEFIVAWIWGGLQGIWEMFKTWYGSFVEEGESAFGAIRLMLMGILTIAAAVAMFATFGWIPALAVAIGGVIMAAINPFSTGGIVKNRGIQLVGEKGPELVSLPVGSRVYSNAESKRMGGNTINVTVQGRVGASDAELREIAQKIGQMINIEINRTTSSRTRGI